MKVLVTTSFSALVIDIIELEAFVIDRGLGLYFGIAKTPEGIVVGARRRMMSSPMDRSSERGCLVLFDTNGSRVLIEPPIPLRDLHGIAYFDDALWITCSLDEQVVILKEEKWTKWHPLGAPYLAGIDTHHFNTIHEREDFIYLLAHNFGDSEIFIFDRKNLSLLNRIPMGSQIHDIWFDDENMRVCSSGEGKILGSDGLSIDVGPFPRGHAYNDQFHLIGLNEYEPRALRDSTSGKIVVMDSNYQVVKSMEFAGEGMILDIMDLSDEVFLTLKHGSLSHEVARITLSS